MSVRLSMGDGCVSVRLSMGDGSVSVRLSMGDYIYCEHVYLERTLFYTREGKCIFFQAYMLRKTQSLKIPRKQSTKQEDFIT